MSKEGLRERIEDKIPIFEEKRVYLPRIEDSFIPNDVEMDRMVREGETKLEPQEDFKAITEKGSHRAVSIVSDKYELVQTRESFKNILEELPDNIEGSVTHYHSSGQSGMKIFLSGKDIGIWVMNGVDAGTAVRVNFIDKKEEETIHIPRSVAGYHRIHRGEVKEEFEDFMGMLSEVRSTWEHIVNELSSREADEEDFESIHNIIGKEATKKLEEWVDNWKIRADGSEKDWNPSVWKLIVWSIKIVSNRNYTSRMHKEERIRALSSKLMAHALKS